MGGDALRWATALLIPILLGGCLREDDAVVVPVEHPANPYAESAPAIRVPAIRAQLTSVTPDLAREAPQSPAAAKEQQAPPSKGGHQHAQ